VDRDALGGTTTGRPACDPSAAGDPSHDGSLFGPASLAQYTPPSRGPLSVFGPYSDGAGDGALDGAKMSTTPALLRPTSGDVYVFAAGTSREPGNLSNVVPPCLARLHVHLAAGEKAYFDPDFAKNTTATFANPGAPVVTSHDGGQDAVVWVLDQASSRASPTIPKPGFLPPNAKVFAFDGTTMETLWQSGPDDLGPSGKYGHVVVAHGQVIVGTDRITAFRPR
jgi:hypothetical protein